MNASDLSPRYLHIAAAKASVQNLTQWMCVTCSMQYQINAMHLDFSVTLQNKSLLLSEGILLQERKKILTHYSSEQIGENLVPYWYFALVTCDDASGLLQVLLYR